MSRGIAGAQMALLPLAAFTVHQLRYLFAFGGHAGAVLRATGHTYLNSIVPWIVALVAVVAGAFLRALGRACARETTAPRYAASLAGLWLACSLALIGIYIGQELLEGIFLAGHPTGWVGVFGYGGWWALPSAAIVGLVLASLLHGALWVLREVARRVGTSSLPPRRHELGRSRPADDIFFSARGPLVGGWSDRGPPVAA
jgi:hypothetical protein